MIQSDILLSIIIPTKNRHAYLIEVVSSLINYLDDEDIEIIIQDNSEQNFAALNFLESVSDKRIKYFYDNRAISIKENTNLGISNCSGEYVTFIGDDDLVNPYICDIVRYMKSRNIESLIFNSGKYWWSNVNFKNPNYYERPSVFTIPKKISTEFIRLNTEEEFNVMLKHGCTSSFRTPKFYHGIITNCLLQKVKDKVSISPDISFSTSLSLVCQEHYYINFPVTIYGASKNSGGGMTMEKKHYGKIEDLPWLPPETKRIWGEFIPEIWSEHTAYIASVSHVLEQFGSKKKIAYNVFYSSMFVYEFYLFKYIKPKIFKYNQRNILKYCFLITEIFKRIAGLIINTLRIKLKLVDVVVHENYSIEDCMIELKKIPFNAV